MANVNIYDMADTWNNAGTTFTAIKMNVTDTASGASSRLIDLQIASTSYFWVDKVGSVFGKRSGGGAWYFGSHISGSSYSGLFEIDVNTLGFSANGTAAASSAGIAVRLSAGAEGLWVKGGLGISSSSAVNSLQTYLYTGGSNILEQRNGTNQQTFRAYGTYTDASNYRRVVLTMTTAGVASLSAEGAGTGSSGNVLHISSLPTSNPGPGILWNNAGTPAIGT